MEKCIHLMVFILLFTSCGSRNKVISKSFSDQQINMIMSSNASKPMRVFKINNTKDSILLRTQSAYIKPDLNNKVLKHFTERLFATVRDSLSMGVGIAAPQVGILKNIIWVQRFDKDEAPFEVYLNPKIVNYSQTKQTRREGCLSIPDRTDIVNTRSKKITITYDTMEGQHVTEVITDFTAVIFQHEIDHLYGILYLDHLEKEIKDAN
ncbi:peptide deformylase [Olleya sp. HaHaR_3_96]|uniref:peptide deformylase n=1 Tax=Olleya sp. HaHaR_3_96 TaxID=2745560 RepID=UPI001C4E44C4|nr:peptide deformylase [Olleya sp. HaHaR_3_96]QXP61170.1 peptide deformylase [Olleya sp. HaHaR_3_96]